MGKANRWKAGILFGVGLLLFGCATSRDVGVLDEEVFRLESELKMAQKEKDSFRSEFNAFRKESQNDISTLKKELASFQKEFKTSISTFHKEEGLLRAGLIAEFKALQSDLLVRLQSLHSQLNRVQTEKDSLRNDFTAFVTEIKALQSDLLLRLQALQSQLNRVQIEKDSLRSEFIAFQKGAQGDISTLKEEDKLLKTDLDSETRRSRADFLLRMEGLQSETRTLSTGVEEYRELLKKSSTEMDRLRENIASRMKFLEEKEKALEERGRVQEDRTRALVEKGKTFEARNQVQEDRTRALEEKIRGTEGRLEGRFKDLDEKIGSIASKQMELEKSVQAKGPPVTPQNLYDDAYEAFKTGDLERARSRFEVFLREYPTIELSDNAQFLIGETYYEIRDFEKAILEYENVLARYPEGDAAPAALFKQGLAFLELGDQTNARNLLKRLIERYPQFDQVEVAKKKLESMK